MEFPLPENEEARLQAVYGCNILDTEAEGEFNDLTLLASLICEAPIALITILDEHRQWFKSKVGINVSETPRNIAFCAYSICQTDVFIVSDATQDARFANNPLVTGETKFQFYAGAPLIHEENLVLGTICVLDTKPRQITPDQIKCLQTLARQVVDKIQLKKRTLELVQTNSLLSQSEERYRFLTEAISQQVWTASPDGKLTYVNSRVLEYFGAKENGSEFMGDGWMKFVHSEDIPAALAVWQEALTTGKSREYKFRLQRYDGEYRWHLVQVMPIFDADGTLLKWFGTNTDIQDLTLANENLRQSESYKNLFQHAKDAIIVFDPQTSQILDVNDRACAIYEFERADFIGKNIKETLSDATECEEKAAQTSQVRPLSDFETTYRRSDGSIIHFLISPSSVKYKGKTAVLSINRDITERVSIEESLRRSEAEMRAIFCAMSDVILIISKTGYFQKIAPTNPRLLYKPADELLDKHVNEIFPLDKAVFFQRNIDKVLNGENPLSVEYELEIDNHKFWFSAIASSLDEHSVMWVARDITERREAEDAVRQSRQMLQFVIDTIPQAVFWKDRNLVFMGCNTYLSQATGLDEPRQIVGKTDYDLSATREQAEFFRECDRRIMTNGVGEYHISETLRLQDGTEAWLDTTKVPLRNSKGEVIGILGTFEDITYRKKAEAERQQLEVQLQQAQKMESIGTLAGGVAHDFNNLLTVIMSSVELLQRQIEKINDSQPNLIKRLGDIETAANRGASLTRQLLAFSRRQQLERKNINLNDVITDIIKLLERLIGADVEISVKLATNLKQIYADPAQIEQVIMNLVINARDAMPEGGKIIIQTRQIALGGIHQTLDVTAKTSNYVQISVSDAGTGMSSAVKERIFEPFFTTKEVGKGTGLGLAMVYGIVKQHDGHIEVHSEPGSGATFEIYFPIQETSENNVPSVNGKTVKGGAETILLAEDEEMLRELSREMLEVLGYKVIAARNGQESVQLYQTHRHTINLVLLDLVMPELSGNKAYQIIREINPTIPIIFTTGYGDKRHTAEFSIETEQEKAVNIGFLPKPFNLQMLGNKIREILDKSDA